LQEPQVQAFQFSVHISYLLQKCKKRQTRWNGFPLIQKRYHRFWTHC